MASRPIFVPNFENAILVKEIAIPFKYYAGLSLQQKQRSVASLHSAAKTRGIYPILEISTKSMVELGRQLSAFNLTLSVSSSERLSVEAAFQGSKEYERGGPFRDLYKLTGQQIKADKRLRESGDLLAFVFDGVKWPLEPKTAFYDWLYVTALIQNPELTDALSDYQGFSDIEFNPQKSINCQARSAALFVSLKKRNMLRFAFSSPEVFVSVLKTGYSQIPESQKTLSTRRAPKTHRLIKTLARDTAPGAEVVLIRLWSEMPAWRKLELVGEINAAVKTLARAGVAQRFPNAAPEEIERHLKDVLLGEELAARVYGNSTYGERIRGQ
jgi:Family of unknown function (DUF6977)